MTWFSQREHFDKAQLTLVHITDSHVFAEPNGEYFCVNTANNLAKTLACIKSIECDAIIFGGDLTQDHSEASYHLFAQLVQQAGLSDKLFWLPGNHDEIEVYREIFSQYGIRDSKVLENAHWQVLLANSKGPTPAGCVSETHLNEIKHELTGHTKHALLFTHHHPIPIQGYLDKHMLENGEALLSQLTQFKKVKGLIHGHVHNEYSWLFNEFAVFATPATSIQFEKNTSDWQQVDLGPAFRMIRLQQNGSLNTQVVWLNNA
ncbi:MAG: metallophosphoesterase [Pseudomonadota bacterium]|nr:metallophosphoesterase [Pseudomonadota bacterium]